MGMGMGVLLLAADAGGGSSSGSGLSNVSADDKGRVKEVKRRTSMLCGLCMMEVSIQGVHKSKGKCNSGCRHYAMTRPALESIRTWQSGSYETCKDRVAKSDGACYPMRLNPHVVNSRSKQFAVWEQCGADVGRFT